MRTSRVLLAVAGLVLPLAVTSAAPTLAGPAGAQVTVENMAFGPSKVTVGMGQSVTWTFEDLTSHTATSDNGLFDTGTASGGQQRSVTFRSAGTFAYHCRIHPHMTGRVVVPMVVSGSRADGWKLVWRVGDNLRNRSYDVQVRRVGTTAWTFFRRGTTKASGRYDPGTGRWEARARTKKGTARSGWSPVAKLP